MSASYRPSAPMSSSISVAPQGSLGRQASPGLTVNLGSNNPFRTRALSPSNSAALPATHAERPTSTNPFLDNTDIFSPHPASAPVVTLPPRKLDLTDNARDVFENLSLNQTSRPVGTRLPPQRLENASSNDRPARPMPQIERSERREKNLDALDVFADPLIKPRAPIDVSRNKERQRYRRNSESSVMERAPKFLDADDDRRRRERRRREREARHKDGKSRSRKNHQLDIIDKLDVTSIYGTGMFHHDGPFDACNPNRNRKGLRTAPMQAFPKDSNNMAIGGSGPNKKTLDLDLVYGITEQGFNDFGSTGTVHGRKFEGTSFDPTTRIEPVHGSETAGLGTSTFLEGAPASRAAMRRESENEAQIMQNGNLQRKKSLAQRIRGSNSSKAIANRVISPDRLGPDRPTSGRASFSRDRTLSGSPYDRELPYEDYNDSWGRKEAKIKVAEEVGDMSGVRRIRSFSNPKQGSSFERKFTEERSNVGWEEGANNNAGGGLISRMKSLRKPKPERRMADD